MQGLDENNVTPSSIQTNLGKSALKCVNNLHILKKVFTELLFKTNVSASWALKILESEAFCS